VIVNLVNYGAERNIDLYLGNTLIEKAYDIIRNETIEGEITLKKYIPVTVEIDVDNPFIDTYGHWAEANISKLHNEGIVSGVEEHIYAPQKTLTRAEFLSLLMRCVGIEKKAYREIPADVARNTWYESAVGAAVECGIISKDENFRPNDRITREEMCNMLVNCYEYKNGDVNADVKLSFTDADAITNISDVEKAVSLELMYGHDDGSFAPLSTATRAEAAAVIERFNK